MTNARSPLRALRAALFAVVCVALAAVGHSSMSVHDLAPSALLGAFAVTALAAWAAAGRRRGAPSIAGALLLLQVGLHLAFSLTGAHSSHGTPAHAGGAPVPHGTPHAVPGMPGMAGMAGTAPETAADGTGMLAAHLLAALLCGLWLAHGEAALFTLARAAVAYAFTPLRLLLAVVRVPDAPRGPARATRAEAHRPHTVVLAHALSRRGPPRLSAPRATVLGAHV
ncbi:hypothetical protein [Streptomyces sp. NPDC003327]